VRKLILFLLASFSLFGQASVSNITFFDGSHSSVGISFTVSTTAVNAIRMHYIPTAQGSCTSGNSGAYQYLYMSFYMNGNNPDDYIKLYSPNIEMNVSGLSPDTQYQFCPEVSTDGGNTWSSGVGATWTTLKLPSVHPALPIAPSTFDTTYPDTTQGTCWSTGQPGYCTVVESVSGNTCPDLANDLNTAVSHQNASGTVIEIPAGSTCLGQIAINNYPPDVIQFDGTKIVNNTINLPNHGFSEGQGVIFDAWRTTGYGLTAGAIYFVHVVDANDFQVYPNWEQFTASTTNGSNVVNVQNMLGGYATACGFQNLAQGCGMGVGSPVVGPGIPAGTTVTAYDPVAGTVTLSHAATATAGNVTLTFAGPNIANLHPSSSPYEHLVPWPRNLYWVIVRTSTPDSQFTPAGTRVSPTWASKMAVLEMPAMNNFNNDQNHALLGLNSMESHLWFTGLEFTYAPNVMSADPVPHGALVWQDFLTISEIVYDRDWFHDPGMERDFEGFWAQGHDIAFINSYIDGFNYWHAMYVPGSQPDQGGNAGPATAQSPSGSGTSFTIPAYTGIYYGAPQAATLPAGLTVSWTGTPTIANPEIAVFFDMNDQLQVVAPQGINVTAPGANITYTATGGNGSCIGPNPYGVSVDPLLPQDSNGRQAAAPLACATLNNSGSISALNAGAIPSLNVTEGGTTFLCGFGPGPYKMVNNYIGVPQGIPVHFADDAGSQPRGDYLVQRNTFHIPMTKFTTASNPAASSIPSDGYDYRVRQLLEWKAGQRIKIDGNIFSDYYHEIAVGGLAIMLTPANAGTITDVDITNNTFQHGPGGISLPLLYDSTINNGIAAATSVRNRVQNNLFWDMNGFVYGTGSAILFGNSPISASPGLDIYGGRGATEDVLINHNTIYDTLGVQDSFLTWPGYPVEGMVVTNNIIPYNIGAAGQNMFMLIQTANSACLSASSTNEYAADCNFIIGVGNPNFTFANNVIIPGWDCAEWPLGSYNCSGSNGNSQVTNATMTGTFPYWSSASRNIWLPTSSSSTVPGSLASVGWWNINFTSGLYDANGNYSGPQPDFHLKSSSAYNAVAGDGKQAGADIDALEAAQGKVTLVGANQITSSSANITYVAPDSASCSVDYSSSDPTLIDSFSRITDTGGARVRNVALSGLAGRTAYYYRVNCAVQQPIGSFHTN
jgi:hypothetical protein